MTLARTFGVLFYSFLISLLARLLRGVSPFSKPLKSQLEGRPSATEIASSIARERARFPHSAVFFCSSAGEYEQAKPLLERLERDGNVFILIFFFSKSGLEFARVRGERQKMSLTPLTDSVWAWGSVFAAARPTVTVIVRHEIWPGFLTTASHYGPVHLIDSSVSLGERRSLCKRWVRRHLLRPFQHIYTVTSDDLTFFRDTYHLPAAQLSVAGDTKYDRVVERARAKKDQIAALKALLDGVLPCSYRLTVGSAHKPDVEALIAAYQSLGARVANWQIVLAPHHVTADMLTWIHEHLTSRGIRYTLFSTLEAASGEATQAYPFVLVDRMGLLAELYATGHAALVGGAFHHQVHNVLEPACRGLALAWGPFYKNSQEAINLVHLGLADVLSDAQKLATWWDTLPSHLASKSEAMTAAVAKLCGASDKIMTDWQTRFRSSEAR